MDFSQQIKHIRQNQFLSQESLAKELGVSFATINRWEQGKTKPTYKTLKLLAEYCEKHNISFAVVLKETKK